LGVALVKKKCSGAGAEPALFHKVPIKIIMYNPLFKMKFVRCARAGCRRRPGMPEVALCRWCTMLHCARHRLPEDHTCPEIGTCRDAAFEGNRTRLEAAKCAPQQLEKA